MSDEATAPPTKGRNTAGRTARPSVGQTIGGILVGFDEQVWRQRPPAQERVASTDRALRVSAPGGRTIELPPDLGSAGFGQGDAADAPGDATEERKPVGPVVGDGAGDPRDPTPGPHGS